MREGVHSRYAHGEGHTALCYTTDGKYIITCGSDCDLRRWECNMDEDESPLSVTLREPATCIIEKNNLVYVGSGHFVEAYTYPELKYSERPLQFSAAVTDVDISSDGKTLVAGACDMKIKIKNLKTNEITELLNHTAPILRVVLNEDVKYVASSSCDGSVKVWDTSTGENLKTFTNVIPTRNDFFTAESFGSPVWCDLSESCLAVIDHMKVCMYRVGNWSLAFELTCKNIKRNISSIAASQRLNFLCAGTAGGEIIVWHLQKQRVVTYIEDHQKPTITAVRWNPRSLEFACSDRLGRICISSVEGKVEHENGMEDNLDKQDSIKNNNEDYENVISISEIKAYAMPMEDENFDDESDNENEVDGYETKKLVPLQSNTELQSAFQPFSSPIHFERGYMVWNSVGIVIRFNSRAERSIDVEFHDTMLHHAIHRPNSQDYTMATLNSEVLCLASESLITCVHFNGWDEKKEWSLDMSIGEIIIAIASSGNWVCCATNLNQLRFFGYTGMQRQIVSLPGPVVCMNGHESLLIVAFHMGVGLPGYQNLGYRIFEVTDFFIKAIVPSQPLPLSPEAKLCWLGFTDEGTPCTYDSDKIIRFSRDFLNWEVACNVGQQCKSKPYNYYLIGVSERLQCARCVQCKGSSFPMTLPRPTVVEIPLMIPLCNPGEVKSINEDIFWRHVFSLPALVEPSHENDDYKTALKTFEKELKQSVIKLFAEAHRNKADMRAVSLASLMSQWPLEMAMKLVQGEGRYLSDKLHNIIPKDWSELRQGPTRDMNVGQYVGLVSNMNENNVRNEIRNKYTHKSQGDMFELSQPSPSNGTGSLLVACREKDSPQEERSSSCHIGNSAYVNPFKVQNKEDQGPRGLSFFNTVKQSNLKPMKGDTASVEKASKGKQGNSSKEKLNSMPKKMKFFDWFNSQKSALQERYPDLNLNELTKVGMKLYREESNSGKQKQKKEGSENDGDMEQSPETKRLKMEDEKTKAKASAADKLSAFNFVL